MNEINGVINVLKPPGMTSHDVVSFIRKIYRLKRVGHAGTLDPAAAGVLPVFLGKSTRLIEYLSESAKSYRTLVTFGVQTDTGDDTGKVIKKVNNFTMPSLDVIKDTLNSFIGEIDQLPPMYSAIKINGKKLYELARQGLTVERQSRKITIYSLDIVKMDVNSILFDVTCSKGTYIRTLCQDIGIKLDLPATMAFLVRTKAGNFNLAEAWSLEEIEKNPHNAYFPADIFLLMPTLMLDEEKTFFFQTGRKNIIISLDDLPKEDFFEIVAAEKSLPVKIYDSNAKFIGIGRLTSLTGNNWRLSAVKVLTASKQIDGDR